MVLQNSYIFLKNPYAKEEETTKREDDGKVVFIIGKNLYSYIKDAFPSLTKVDGYGNFYRKKYYTDLQYGKVTCTAEFVITEVVDTRYLDVLVKGKTKAQIVKCLEHIQFTLLTSGVREKYIDIISYDAVSEYYCNKIYPKLNTLERNLRKLLFNIYIVNFGRDYYKATVDEELQGKIKGVINTDSSKEQKNNIKSEYNATSKKEAEEIERLQRFFYSFEYNDIQKLLFTPSWTNSDAVAKSKFLEEHPDLSELTDEALREAFAKYVPRSDWERFFSKKIDIPDIKDLIDQIRVHRNSVAHFKFFYKAEYDECNTLVNRLNAAIIKAIKITEEKDFSEKNAEILSEALKDVLAGFAVFTKSIAEIARKTFSTVIAPAITSLSKTLRQNTWTNAFDSLTLNAALTKETRIQQELPDAAKPSSALVQGIIPPLVDETQSLLHSIRDETPIPSIPKINIPAYDIPKLNIDMPQSPIIAPIDVAHIDLDVNISPENENSQTSVNYEDE